MDTKAIWIGSLALALTLSITACKKGGDEAEVEVVDAGVVEPTDDPTEVVDAGAAAPVAPAADMAMDGGSAMAEPVDESLFIKAYYEVTCVQTKVDDIEKQKEIIGEVLPRYGFTEESYNAAKAQLESKENIKLVLTDRMKLCTKEAALGFVAASSVVEDMGADMAAGEDMATAEDPKKPAKPQPVYVGKLADRGIRAGDIVQTELTLNIQKDFLVLGGFKGMRDGKRFNIALRGNVDKSGSMVLNGSMGQNRITLRGKLTKSGASGSIEGTIHGNPVNARFNAPK